MRGFGNDRVEADPSDFDHYEEDSVIDAPPPVVGQDERRMQVRAYNFWAGLLGEHRFPSVQALLDGPAPDFADHAVLLNFDRGMEDPAIAQLGAGLAQECETDASLRRLSDVPGRSLLSRITDHYMQIIANEAPIGFEAEFVNQRGRTILYRGILLPFSSDDTTIDYIYGVINWKELADQHTTDELLLEIGQALDVDNTKRKVSLEPLSEWADGPATLNLPFDTTLDLAEFGAEILPFPEPAFGVDEGILADLPGEDNAAMELADWLASARELAHVAHSNEDRTRSALYAAIGRAFDFALAAQEAPHDFAELIADAGLTMQDRAPMTPVVKLVFGADYDKTRLTEYASALTHAQRVGLGRGELGRYLSEAPGGLKAVINAERKLRRDENGKGNKKHGIAAVAEELRAMPSLAIGDLTDDGEEFALLLCRRLSDGTIVLLGNVGDDEALLERAARKLVG
jgi:hypothetical protein